MRSRGFITEMQALRQRGDLHAELPAMRSVGYRQAWQALEHDEPLPQWREKAIAFNAPTGQAPADLATRSMSQR